MKIYLNNRWYEKKAIKEAIAAYSEIVKIELLDDSFTLEIPENTDYEYLDKEFANYVLGMQHNQEQ